MTPSIIKRISDNNFVETDHDVIEYVKTAADKGLSDDELIGLTKAIANSSTERWTTETNVIGFSSTGGPTSLSTLAVPFLTRICGAPVFEVSATGRPAGAIDTLQTLPGYRFEPSPADLMNILNASGCVHILQTSDFAPADKKLIAIRRAVDAMASPDLAIASLLGKKLNSPTKRFVLDTRVGTSGNIGADFAKALEFSKRYVRIANSLGMTARCVLTDLRSWPQSPYLGRSDALAGLRDIVTGVVDTRTFISLGIFVAESLNLFDTSITLESALLRFREATKQNCFDQIVHLLEHHGVRAGAFENRLKEIDNFFEFPLRSRLGGIIQTVDLKMLKTLMLELSDLTLAKANKLPVWEIGMRWRPGQRQLIKGDSLFDIRVRHDYAPVVQLQIGYFQTLANHVVTVKGANIERSIDPPPVVISIVDERGIERNPYEYCNTVTTQ